MEIIKKLTEMDDIRLCFDNTFSMISEKKVHFEIFPGIYSSNLYKCESYYMSHNMKKRFFNTNILTLTLLILIF